MVVWLLICAVILVGTVLWWNYARRPARPAAGSARAPRGSDGDYRCVEFKFKSDACHAVRMFEGMRFLHGQAPEIPVPGCDAAKCACHYVHHADRRHEDRRSPTAYQPPGSDRRIKRDRRRTPKSPTRQKPRR
jgi:hypothetical protein